MTQTEFINHAVGKPWVSRACGPDSYDCWGLVIDSFAKIECVKLPDISAYLDFSANDLAGLEGVNEHDTIISDGRDGDIMLMFNENGDFEHVGRVLSGGVIHAWGQGSNGTGQVKWDRIGLLKRLYKNKVEFRRYASFSKI